ncbi:MAG TPA: PA14 domain-containing protein [Bryobacteraceae bacterium]
MGPRLYYNGGRSMSTGRRLFAGCLAASGLFALCLIAVPAMGQPASSPHSSEAAAKSEDQVAHFGTTVFSSTGLRGDVYFIPPESKKLPKFDRMKPVGTIYTSELNVPRHDFTLGFPGVTDRFEWFAIDYNGKFWVDKPGKYTWALMSDDGSKLYIDGHEVIDNDGVHGPKGVGGEAKLKAGEHRIRVSYFQGPRTQVALILAVIPPGDDEFSLFSTDDYLSPEARAAVRKSKNTEPRDADAPKIRRKPGEDFVMGPVIR